MKNTVILFIAHFINEDTMGKYKKLKDELSDTCDVVWVLQKDRDNDMQLPDNIHFYTFSLASISELQYELLYDDTIYYNVNFILQRFFKDNPKYGRYWSIEYDVVFTGNWHTLIDCFENEDADLISCHIAKYTKGINEHWDWWKSTVWIDEDIPLEKCVKAFSPIYSLSNKALEFLDGFFRKGNSGHFETIMSTALHYHGFKLLDMGGVGEFTPPEFRNKFYIQGAGINNGTMRFRPKFLKEEVEAMNVPDKLFHPLK